MRIYPGQARTIAREVIHQLTSAGEMEVESDFVREAEDDVESVILQYIRTDREISDEVREIIHDRGLGNNAFGRIRKRIARERNFCNRDDALDWITQQTIEMLLYSSHVEEVYGDDRDLRKAIARIVRTHAANIENELDQQVRGRLKNLQEGSTAWDIEYERAMGDVKRKKGLV